MVIRPETGHNSYLVIPVSSAKFEKIPGNCFKIPATKIIDDHRLGIDRFLTPCLLLQIFTESI